MSFTPDKAAPLFITGASGFIGHWVARKFHAAGYTNLRLLARNPEGLGIVGAEVPYAVVRGDLRDDEALRFGLKGAEGVIHLAADFRMWVRDPQELQAINVTGARRLAELALEHGIARFLHCSSVAAIGRDPATFWPSDESIAWNLAWTEDAYTISKFEGEQAVKAVFAQGLPGLVVNPGAPIGPGDVRPTPTGQMIVDALNRRIPGWFEGGFDMVDVEDLAAGFVLAYEHGREHQNYILGGDNLTLQQIYLTLEELSGVPAPVLKLPRWGVLPTAALLEGWARLTGGRPILTLGGARMVMLPPWYDDTKARNELGYTTRPFKAALERAIMDFYRRGLATPPPHSPLRYLAPPAGRNPEGE